MQFVYAVGLFQPKNDIRPSACNRFRLFFDFFALVEHVHFYIIGIAADVKTHFHKRTVDIRRYQSIIDVCAACFFQPYALPYARITVIPASVRLRLPELFPAGLSGIIPVHSLYDKGIFGFQIVCNVKRKSRITAFMSADILTVQPDFRRVIHGVETQQNIFFLQSFAQFERPFIPHDFMHFFYADAAGFRLIGKRHVDFSFRRKIAEVFIYFSFFFIVKAEIPLSVESLPVFSRKMRSRVFRSLVFEFHRYLLAAAINSVPFCRTKR